MGLPARFRVLILMVRPFTLLAPVAVTPLVAWAAVDGALLGAWQDLVHVTVTLVLANVAANLWNAASDIELDRVGHPERPVASGSVTPAEAKWIGHAIALFAFARALTISVPFGGLVGVALGASWAYSFRFKPHKISSWLVLGATRGGLGPLAAWSAFASPLEPRILGFAAVGAAYAVSAWAVKDLGDADQEGTTWLLLLWVLFGGLASVILAALLLGPYAAAAAAGGIMLTAGLVLQGRRVGPHPAAWYGAYAGLVLLAAAFAAS